MWIIMIVGTVAFWVAVFIAVRALYFDRASSSAPDRFREANESGERAGGQTAAQEPRQ
ncbi:hypothetical protein [Aestuariimicrobium sp. T2.26MG-19.2B]|uniref:hypothetical protein n=1 Tax=Aestuariimicrobium sp. T2.26MG-19.2B TaxID=3040679 RepID=UPI002541061C|nr:hypothetical protein [Aestuariimicrobium sp. T2.26MG-19.2B]